MIDIHFQRGVHLPEHNLWLDPQDDRDLAFVSHAHADHIARHREVILSAGTSRLMNDRLPGQRVEHILDFDQITHLSCLPGAEITLLPAGHILGSAQIHLQTGAGSLLYTGDFKLRTGQSAEPAQWRQAQTLIMETTFGLPRYVFPPAEEIIRDILKFCHEALEDGHVPVLLGYSLGKAQEILAALAGAGLPVMLHGAVYNMTQLYREMRGSFPEFEPYEADKVQGKVLICPPSVSRSVMLRKIKNRRVAMLSGWAMDPGAIHRYQCDAAFPLSDHADYPDLLRYVELVNPERVLTLHGFAVEFARDLRQRGIEAWALTGENQLELSLDRAPDRMGGTLPPMAPASEPESPMSSFGLFSDVCQRISSITGKKEKIRLLSELLVSLDPVEAPYAAIFLTGRPFAQSDPRTVQTGWSIIRRALLLVCGLSEAAFRARTSGLGDLGKSVLTVLAGRTSQAPFSLTEAATFFETLHQTRGPAAKTALLRDRLGNLGALEAAFLCRILTGDLRIGLKEGLVEESIGVAFDAPAERIREAAMLTGDLGEVARLAQFGTLDLASIRLFHPIQVMLASPEPDAEAIWKRITEMSLTETFAEDKYDGIRAQLHVSSDRMEIFSRDLRPVTAQFPEIVHAAPLFSQSLILDGEILAYSEGKKLTFFDLQKRLGRLAGPNGHADLFVDSDIPIIFTAFDLLFLNGKSLLKVPLVERRVLLRSLTLPPPFRIAEATLVHSPKEIDEAFFSARQRGNEGLIIKDPSSSYLPGRRGLAWFKLKKELATLDVVVTGAEQGHGKRSHVLSDYTFAVRDEQSGALLTIGKAYSGLSDLEIEELTAHFEASTIEKQGHLRIVVPQIVLEIAFDSIQASDRHPSGLAMRFPRIKAIRRDKTPADIDTLAYARRLAGVKS